MRYRTSLSEEVVGGHSLRLHHLENFEGAVDDLHVQLAADGREHELEALCPYFGVLWPGARVLARWVAEQGEAVFAGRRVLELGCGLALPSLVAARLGAEVMASDVHPDVPAFLARNLTLNPGIRLRYRHLDWSRPAPLEPFDWILASDVLYERAFAGALVDFLTARLTASGEAVILDPNRSFWESLVGLAAARGLKVECRKLAARGADEPPASVLLRIRKTYRPFS